VIPQSLAFLATDQFAYWVAQIAAPLLMACFVAGMFLSDHGGYH
jgi:hypothetical protein